MCVWFFVLVGRCLTPEHATFTLRVDESVTVCSIWLPNGLLQAKCSIMPAPTARLHPLALTQRQRLLYGSATNVVETGGSINFFSDWGASGAASSQAFSVLNP